MKKKNFGLNRTLVLKTLLIAVVSICFGATEAQAQTLEGKASFYGKGFHGRRAADGSIYNMYEMTCAHKTLPFGTRLRVTNKVNGKSVIVKVTDRGPYVRGRIVDLSVAAAQQLDMVHSGVVSVKVEILGKGMDVEARNRVSNQSPDRPIS